MKKHSKNVKKQLRELVLESYKRNLEAGLSDLYQQFDKWRQKEINCWELNDLIHEFHDGTSRDLYKRYIVSGNSMHVFLINCALEGGILNLEDISEEVYQALKKDSF